MYWIEKLSASLGAVQHFGNHRVSDYYTWSLARDGHLLRHYCLFEQAFPVFIGAHVPEEFELGLGTRRLDDDWRKWDDADKASTPDDHDVLKIAAKWGVNPQTMTLLTTQGFSVASRVG